jgi:glycosyltransferase involved in cell wall biosynthesis
MSAVAAYGELRQDAFGRSPSLGAAMRLLHVFPSFGLGGQQARLAALARGLGPAIAHQVLSLDGDVSATQLFAGPIDASSLALRKTGFIDAGNIRLLDAAIRQSNASILCTYNFGALEAAVANKLGPRLPHIHQEDGFGPDESPTRQKLRRTAFRRFVLGASTTIVPSRVLEKSAREVWGLPEERIRYLPNGVELERFSTAPRYPSEVLTIGSVGAFRAEKNFARLIRCFVAASLAGGRLELVGDGPELAALRAVAMAAGADVVFPGRTTSPEEAYARFDIFALSSDTEQMPLSLMEAMAAGLPVVATDVGDVLCMVSTLNRPFIVPPEDEQGFAQSLAALAADPDLRRTIGEANRRVAVEKFSVDAMTQAYRALYFSAVLRRS